MRLGQFDAQLVKRGLGDFTVEDIMDQSIGDLITRVGAAKDSFNSKVPLPEPRQSHREAIIAHSRERYYRPRSEVEATRNPPASNPSEAPQEQNAAGHVLQPTLNPDHRKMLERLCHHLEETVTKLHRALGFGGRNGAQVRQQLTERNLVVPVQTHSGKGNRVAVFLN